MSKSSASSQTLANRVAVVTGASSGIGEAIAKILAENGAKVMLAARRLEKLEEIKQKLIQAGHTVDICKVDVTIISDVNNLVIETKRKFGHVDILVNSAGMMYYTLMKNARIEEWNHQVDVNCKGVLNFVGAVLPDMVHRESGHIVNISSDAGRKAFPGLAVYSATKFFVEALSQGIRLETAEHGIKVTTIQPGSVRTPLFQYSTDTEATNLYGEVDNGQFLDPVDIANAVLYAVSQPKNCAVNEVMVEPQQCPI